MELFGDQFHIADSSGFFFKRCKIIGTITEVPLYSIKVTAVVQSLIRECVHSLVLGAKPLCNFSIPLD